jgi:hypothetical protein
MFNADERKTPDVKTATKNVVRFLSVCKPEVQPFASLIVRCAHIFQLLLDGHSIPLSIPLFVAPGVVNPTEGI